MKGKEKLGALDSVIKCVLSEFYIALIYVILLIVCIQEVPTIYEMFDSEQSLLRKAYKHKAVHAVELM